MSNSALKFPPSFLTVEPEVSPNVEMYLKSIVRLYDGEEPVSITAVAQELAISAPSVSAMLKKLDADGYVVHEGRHGVVPTARGAHIGAVTLRRQRLAERLLVDHLGISWEVAGFEACRLEHAISPQVEEHLARFLGEPSTCPHGHPIPLPDGSLWRHDHAVELADLPVHTKSVVLEVKHDMPELLKFLADINIRPGVEITVQHRERVAGLLRIDVAGQIHTISTQLAGDILVQDAAQA
ncbi:MAG: DtxR family transcriptional regulator [Candidatus Eremiobacter antarcticus]|nr:metal-dependent transcriptional regulator [Candidatus Eremiobacteraeota bacterium]MBC5807592.1 metal-dependent transcriptional regulator [Candidatus Eremiobacteraeota bacterium]PZR61356.1 MAG: DtxR family transcriptional regulator [Candidatus Eremiobacter sp. RRmetagenome_bin22]